MKPIIFKGCGTALATPFDEQGINFKVFEEMIENQIENGVDAVVVCGTNEKSSTMTEKERKDAIKFVIDVVKNVFLLLQVLVQTILFKQWPWVNMLKKLVQMLV